MWRQKPESVCYCWTHAALNCKLLRSTLFYFMVSLKTRVGSAPHQPEEWNRMFRTALTLYRIYTFTQMYSRAKGEIQLPNPQPLVSANTHKVQGPTTSLSPRGKELGVLLVGTWALERLLRRGDGWGGPGDGWRCFPRTAQGIHPDLEEVTAWQCQELGK